MIIPKIIHHIAPEDQSSWHPVWEPCRNSFIDNFPDYEHKLWNDHDDIDKLVYDHYKNFWNLYNNFPHHIMKIDFARYCILHQYGGLYADMDYFCYGNFEEYLKHDNIFLENTSDTYTNAKYENSLMACKKYSDLPLNIMRNVKNVFITYRCLFNENSNDWRSVDSDYAVNNTTGSGLLAAFIEKYGKLFNNGKFPAKIFNRDAVIYNEELLGRHVHSGVWGNVYLDNFRKQYFLIKDNAIWCCTKDFIDKGYTVYNWKDFDFYRNYNDPKDNSPNSANK